MAKTVEIPDELHEALEARARVRGISLNEYIAHELDAQAGGKGAVADLLDRIRSRPPVDLGISAADLIREGREERDRQLTDKWLSSTPRR